MESGVDNRFMYALSNTNQLTYNSSDKLWSNSMVDSDGVVRFIEQKGTVFFNSVRSITRCFTLI
jgi:hypothetical protein